MRRWTRRGRLTASMILTVVAALFLLVGGLTLYLRQEVSDEGAFAHRAQSALQKADIRQTISDQIVNTAIERGSTELLQAKPLLQAITDAALRTPAFRTVFRTAALHLHRLAFSRNETSVALSLADVGQVVAGAAKAIAPKLAARIPPDLDARLLDFRKRQWATKTLEVADKVRLLGILLPIAAVLLFAAAIAVAPDRRSAVARSGVGIAVVAAIGFGALLYLRDSIHLMGIGGDGDTVTRAGRELFDVYFADLRTWCLWVGAAGLILAAAATSVLQPVEVAGRARRARALLLRTPATRAGRVARGVAIVAVSLFVVLDPGTFLSVLAILAGAFGLFFGTSEVLSVVTRPLGQSQAEISRRRRRALLSAGATVLVLALLGGGLALAFSGGSETKRPALGADQNPTYCNGFRELCNRNLDQVTFAATHNSMSSASYRGFFFPAQRGTLGGQLNFGVRGLLIDAYYGIHDPKRNRVRTDLANNEANAIVRALPPGVLAAAKRLAGSVGLGDLKGKKELYLCHGLCELGAVRMTDALGEVRDFMAKHPDEVLVIFIEDYVKAADIAKAFKQAGLLRYTLVHNRDAPWPTLRQMITSGKRLLVMAENRPDLPRVPWYQDGFDLTQDTPYQFPSSKDMRDFKVSCALNRGNDNSPLFLVNHWIERFNPTPSVSAKVNAYPFLFKRARSCDRIRGAQRPTLLAVDFYDEGNVLGVVNALNGVPRDAKAQLPTRRGS
ncbi:MAG TPA: hypothetical protein VHR88_11070 [Solirubrobacteraceae bacterium]|nr:hypothetical protein [Solirubrobacteraceae bacterium]